jgi:hypothetical protein
VLHRSLSDPSELGAKLAEKGIECGPDVFVEFIQYFTFRGVHYDHRKLDDFGTRLDLFVLYAGGLEVEYE